MFQIANIGRVGARLVFKRGECNLVGAEGILNLAGWWREATLAVIFTCCKAKVTSIVDTVVTVWRGKMVL